jgi:hypothetical protein
MNDDPFKFSTDYNEESKCLYVSYAKQEDIDNLKIPEDTEELCIYGDYFYKLKVPDGIKSILCGNVGLVEVELPDSIENIYLERNKIEKLEIPPNAQVVKVNNNIIRTLTFRGGDPKYLEDLDLSFNRISKFNFIPPKCLKYVNIWRNYDKSDEDVCDALKQLISNSEDCFWHTPPPSD